MTYQDEIINKLIDAFQLAVINYEDQPNLNNSLHIAKARHELVVFLKEGR